jgi:hypothetical protein
MLMENMRDPEIQFEVVSGPFHFDSLFNRVMSRNFDIIHFCYDSGFLGIFAPSVATHFKNHGAKIVITLNDHHAQNNRAIFPFTNEFDRVVVHQHTPDGFTFIPIGIEEVDQSVWTTASRVIGTSGFPLPQKGILDVAGAAAILVNETDRISGCRMVCPESQHIDTHTIGRQVKAIFPATDYLTAWWDQKEVMRVLSHNLINVYPMRDGKSGISSSIRMGLGTGGYTVLSRSLMHADLMENPGYAEEIEWIEGSPAEITPRKVADACLRVLETKRRPKKILEDMTWAKSSAMYAKLYHEVTGK